MGEECTEHFLLQMFIVLSGSNDARHSLALLQLHCPVNHTSRSLHITSLALPDFVTQAQLASIQILA